MAGVAILNFVLAVMLPVLLIYDVWTIQIVTKYKGLYQVTALILQTVTGRAKTILYTEAT